MFHISKQSSSFILLVILILLSVATVIFLLKINQQYLPSFGPNIVTAPEIQADISMPTLIATDDWVSYQDVNYPIVLQHPEDWDIESYDNIPGYYTLSLIPDEDQPALKVYVSEKGYMAVNALESNDFKSSQNFGGSHYDYQIYAIKFGDYYYTFDGSLNPEFRNELFTIVNTVAFE